MVDTEAKGNSRMAYSVQPLTLYSHHLRNAFTISKNTHLHRIMTKSFFEYLHRIMNKKLF